MTIARLGAAAAPLPFLDYVLDEPQIAAIVDGGATLVRVPPPARFALHKLLVAENRPAAWHAKRDKDLLQAAALVEVLAEDRPGDLTAARRAIEARGTAWTRALGRGRALLRRASPVADDVLDGEP